MNIAGMVCNQSLSRAICDAAWGSFYWQLEYKCPWYGAILVQAPTNFPSSKLCSRCGVKNKELKLSDRVFRCPSCGLTINRDKNAGINLAQYAATASQVGSLVAK